MHFAAAHEVRPQILEDVRELRGLRRAQLGLDRRRELVSVPLHPSASIGPGHRPRPKLTRSAAPVERVAYSTSADVSGDKTRVVGYAGMLFA